jgi:hypothetical protein
MLYLSCFHSRLRKKKLTQEEQSHHKKSMTKMSEISIHSPIQSEILNSLASLSPPPTPIAKRGCHFFPADSSGDATVPVPLFFPTTASVFGSSYHEPNRRILSSRSTHHSDEEDDSVDAELMFLISYPPPRLRLEQRRTVTITPPPLTPSQNEKRFLQVPDDSLKLMIPTLPSLAQEISNNNSDNLSFTLMKRSYPPAMKSQSPCDTPHQKVERRHSFAAKSA